MAKVSRRYRASKISSRVLDSAQTPANPPSLNFRMAPAEVLERVRAAGYAEVLRVEREDGGYEVRARDAQGRRVKLYVTSDGRVRGARDDD